MSSEFRSLLPELLATAEMRAARRDDALLLLDLSLADVLYANEAGHVAFGLSGGDGLSGLFARQIQSGARRVAAGEEVRLALRAPSGRSVSARLRRVEANGVAAVLLAHPGASTTGEDAPSRLLADLGLAERGAAILGRQGVLAAGSGLEAEVPAALLACVAGMIDDGRPSERHSFGGVSARLFLVADEMVLAVIEAEAAVVSKLPEPASGPEARRGGDPMNIAAIVGRWHSRQTAPLEPSPTPGDEPAPPVVAKAPKRFRSFWGTAAATMPVSSEPHREPAAQDSAPVASNEGGSKAGSETAQPLDEPHPTILPDIAPEEAPELDPVSTPDEERPMEGDLLPTDAVPEPSADVPVARAEPAAAPDGETPPDASRFAADFEGAPVRFVWQIDGEGRFRSLSPDFAAAVGPKAADILGLRFSEVAEAFCLDEAGEIARLLERRDTWSGRTVLWPVENTARRVPIDLAALPTYARDRSFDGFRGFGIVRSADWVEDPDALGLALRRPAPSAAMDAAEGNAEPMETDADGARAPLRPALTSFEGELSGPPFGRRQTPPAIADGEEPRIVRFSERRRLPEGILTASEEAAFREIGAKLGQDAPEARTPGALRFEAEPMPGTAPAAEDRDAAEDSQPPVEVEAPSPASAEHEEAAVTDAPAAGEPDADVRQFLAALPFPILVQGPDEAVFANAALLMVAGCEDLDAFNAAGGLDSLFAENGGEASPGLMSVRHRDGSSREMRVHMQRIAFAGRSSLLMSFEPAPEPVREAPAAGPSLEEIEQRRELGELKAVLDIATDGVVLGDADGIVRAANGSAQALFGFGEEDFRGRTVASLFAQESQRTVLDYIETLKDKGLAGILNDGREVVGRVAQGGFVPLFITVGRLSEERGWCLVIRDMSHWKRIEEELVNARRTAEAASLHKSRFLANISHELRTPMNAIIGFADVMASECFGPIGNERYIEYLGDIKRSGHHVLDLVNDLLDISKIEAGKMELNFESVSLNEVLSEVVSVMQPQANRERVIVRSNLPPSVPPVVADRRTIRQIALNLLSNSVRFTPAGGQIIASTTYTAEGDVLMRVRDSGIGMTEREIEIALAPFQQVHQPDTERGKGTGLGLPLTKAMAEANRASFAIHSTPGEGTLVEIGFSAQRVLAE